MRAGAETEGYNLSYSFSLKQFFFISTYVENVVVKFHVSREGLHEAWRI